MAQRVVTERQSKLAYIGSMNHKINIYVRTLTPSSITNFNYDETFTLFKSVWSMIQTVTGKTMFDSSNIEKVVSHKIWIRYLSNITSEYWISYKNEYYDIVSVENLENENRFQILYCTIRGSTSNKSNLA